MAEQTHEITSLQRKLLPVNTEIESVKQGRSIVVAIGINDYANWQKLKNGVQDAVGFQQTLIDKLGFVAPIPPLIDSAATRDANQQLRRKRTEYETATF